MNPGLGSPKSTVFFPSKREKNFQFLGRAATETERFLSPLRFGGGCANPLGFSRPICAGLSEVPENLLAMVPERNGAARKRAR